MNELSHKDKVEIQMKALGRGIPVKPIRGRPHKTIPIEIRRIKAIEEDILRLESYITDITLESCEALHKSKMNELEIEEMYKVKRFVCIAMYGLTISSIIILILQLLVFFI